MGTLERHIRIFFALALIAACAWTHNNPVTAYAGELPQSRSLAITVDDLPGAVPGSDSSNGQLRDLQSLNAKLIRVLLAHRAPATGLVIGRKLEVTGERDARVAILQEWIDAGLDLGNHTYSHQRFSSTSLETFEDDTIRGDVVTRLLMAGRGGSQLYFRHPALDTGPTSAAKRAFNEFLTSRAYRVAPVTVENADYEFNDVLSEATASRDETTATATRSAYLDHTSAMFDYVESASKTLFHREIPQILLIHDNEINAEMLDTLLTNLEHRGYRFVSLDAALGDPAYSSQEVNGFGRCYVCWGQGRPASEQRKDYPWSSVPAGIHARFEAIRKRTGN